MHYFCTLFDSNYLTRGLALYRSLEATGTDFQLFIFAFDDLAYDMLTRLSLSRATIISMDEFEDERLRRIKGTRTQGEYCWTCSCFSIKYVLEHYHLPEVTYLDSDIYFFATPDILLKEFDASGADVLITGHRYTPRYDQTATSGKYCVQFMTFKNNANGMQVLNWWCNRCDEWCYARFEDGKFGDQKYLDDWPERFQGVHELQHIGGGAAPWNIQQYLVTAGPQVDGQPVVFYHFHNLRLFDHQADLSSYQLSKSVRELIYRPYLVALADIYQYLQRQGFPNFRQGILEWDAGRVHTVLRKLRRSLHGINNFVSWSIDMGGKYDSSK